MMNALAHFDGVMVNEYPTVYAAVPRVMVGMATPLSDPGVRV